jgi:hypothetical protein
MAAGMNGRGERHRIVPLEEGTGSKLSGIRAFGVPPAKEADRSRQDAGAPGFGMDYHPSFVPASESA